MEQYRPIQAEIERVKISKGCRVVKYALNFAKSYMPDNQTIVKTVTPNDHENAMKKPENDGQKGVMTMLKRPFGPQ